MKRAIGVVVVAGILASGCVDTAEPTGPAPNPPGDEGELTSLVEPDVSDGEATTASARKRPNAPR